MAAFALKKSFISKLKNITTIASVRIANLTRVRIAMASPIQSGAGVLLPWFFLSQSVWIYYAYEKWFHARFWIIFTFRYVLQKYNKQVVKYIGIDTKSIRKVNSKFNYFLFFFGSKLVNFVSLFQKIKKYICSTVSHIKAWIMYKWITSESEL